MFLFFPPGSFLVGNEGVRALYIPFKGFYRVPHSLSPYEEPASFSGFPAWVPIVIIVPLVSTRFLVAAPVLNPKP